MHKAFKACTAVLLALVMTVSLVSGALAVAVRNDDDTISYEPLEQGVYSKGGYTIDKVSHPTLGAGEVDGILTGDLQDRGQSYSWSMAEAGDYVYIGTCYNSTYYIYHNNVKTSLDAMKKEGKLDQNVDTSRAAADFVKVMFGTDTFDETPMSQWTPVIMAVNRYTGEAQVIFRERDILKDYPDIFPGYPPYLKGVNYLAGYRMAFEFKGKIYFAGMGSPTATLIEVDPETNECSIAYHNINYTQGVSNGVHGLLVFDDEIYMCLATDNYDGKGTPGGIIVASSDPTAGLSSWRRVADQDDFDGLPAGTSQVELEFFWQEVGTQQEEVLASFTLDLANQEITAAGTQGVELGSTQYSLLETGDTGWGGNGFTVKDVWFSQAESSTGHVYFYLPDGCLETNLQVEVQNAQGETLFRSQAYGEDGASNPDWTLQPAFTIANLPQPLNICQVTQRLTGAVVPVGEMVTVILSDASTGETLFTDTRALVAAAP